jgi:hypothetical protein
MTPARQSQDCDHNRTRRRLWPSPLVQIQLSVILRMQISTERNAGSQKTTATYDGHARIGNHEPAKSSRIHNTHTSQSP